MDDPTARRWRCYSGDRENQIVLVYEIGLRGARAQCLLLLPVVLVRFVTADHATGKCADSPVMAGVMPYSAAYQGTFDLRTQGELRTLADEFKSKADEAEESRPSFISMLLKLTGAIGRKAAAF
jgi:hypothetical protein